jgi:hypothetical protein
LQWEQREARPVLMISLVHIPDKEGHASAGEDDAYEEKED